MGRVRAALLLRGVVLIVALAVAVTAGQPEGPAASDLGAWSGWLADPAVAAAAPLDADATWDGTLTILWIDPPPASGQHPSTQPVLRTADWHDYNLILDSQSRLPPGGLDALDGRHVRIAGPLVQQARGGPDGSPATIRVSSIAVLDTQPAAPGARPRAEAAGSRAGSVAPRVAVSGPTPWVNLLCQFSDANPATHRPKSYFDALFQPTFPSLTDYYREDSYGTIDVSGSTVYDWRTLPHEEAYYQAGILYDLGRLTQDCTDLFADVNFPSYYGINIMIHGTAANSAEGTREELTLNGQTKTYGISWNTTSLQGASVLAHEMGHGYGLSHTVGPNETTSLWDVMGAANGTCQQQPHPFGCLPPGFISYHRDTLGWILANRKLVPQPGTVTSIALERLQEPPLAAGTFLMAQIPIQGSTTHFYTVEARKLVSYDQDVPLEGVVLHEVDTTRGEPAAVVDGDGNSNANDAGAVWLPGETFTDAALGLSVAVTADNGTGYQVTIDYHPAVAGLTITKSGYGTGTVIAVPAGINCGAVCFEAFATGTQVTLTATPSGSSTFTGWGGACAGTATCQVTMDAARTVVATFDAPKVGVTVHGGPSLTASLTARAGCGTIDHIQFGEIGQSLGNARVTIASPAGGPSSQTSGFSYTPPAGTTAVSLSIARVVPSGGATVNPIHFVDGCGEWHTFVGGGPSAFQ